MNKSPYARRKLGLTAPARGTTLEVIAAIKPHVCSCCRQPIDKGDVYYRETLGEHRQDGWRWKSWAFHWDCWFAGAIHFRDLRDRPRQIPFRSMEASA